MKGFAISATIAIGIVFYSSVASANSRIASAGTTGQSAMQFLNAEKAQSNEQGQRQISPEPSQLSVPVTSTQQSDNSNRKATCMLRPVTAGGQAKIAISAMQFCPLTNL
jgi:hypothetical protein